MVEKLQDGSLRITGNGISPIASEVNCGESGLGIRMFAPLIALSEKRITINGEGSLLKRPMDFFDEIFPRLSIDVISNSGKLPLKIKGPLQPRDIDIDGSLSSQFLTGLANGVCGGRGRRGGDHRKQPEQQAIYRPHPAGNETFWLGGGKQGLRIILF